MRNSVIILLCVFFLMGIVATGRTGPCDIGELEALDGGSITLLKCEDTFFAFASEKLEATYMRPTTSVPFAGGTTPAGIMIVTSSTEPPTGFSGGELYLYVDDIRGWEQK